MPSFVAKLVKHSLVAVGVLVILLAIAVGGARLLFTQLPGYGDKVTSWIAEEVGLDVDFESIDVRFSLRGPEISFREASVTAPGHDDPFLSARRAAVTIDPVALAMARDGFVSRLTLEGTRITVVRDEAGRFELQGAPLLANRRRLLERLPARVQFALADTVVVYRDLGADVVESFDEVELSLVRSPDRLMIEMTATPPPTLGAGLDISVEAALAAGTTAIERWQLEVAMREADFAVVSPLLRVDALPAVEGRGDLRLTLASDEDGLTEASAAADVSEFALPELAATPEWVYERIELDAKWTREPGSAWTLELDDVALARNGRSWVAGGDSVLRFERLEGAEARRVSLTSDFVRLEDLNPFLLLLPPSADVRRWLDADLRGDLVDLDLELVRRDEALEYDVSGDFRGLGMEPRAGRPGFDGLTGELRADSRSGRVRFASPSVELDWATYAREPLNLSRLHGVVVWRQGRDALRVVSDDLAFSALGGSARSSLELTFPVNGGSPRADIEATLSEVDVVAVRRHVSASVVPEPVVDWLDTALDAGTARNVELELYGPLNEFPFDDGQGQLRVAADVSDAEIEFVEDWPRALDLDGRVEFLNASFAARGSGRVLGNRTRELEIAIDDFREPVLHVDTVTDGPLPDVLAFIKSAPLIAEELGPELERLRVHDGAGRVDLDLDLPLLDFGAFSLAAGLAIDGGELSVDGFAPRVREVTGELALAGTDLTAEALEGVFLDGPVSIRVGNADTPAYRALIEVDGESTLEAVRRQFDLPFAERVGGQTRWRGELWIPAQSSDEREPARVRISSNLAGVALRFPPPLEKAPAEPSTLDLDFEFRETGLAVDGNVGATRRFVLRYVRDGERFEFAEGAVRFGGDAPKLPGDEGLTVSGRLPRLDVDRWLELVRTAGERPGSSVALLSARFELAELLAFGQHLGSASLEVRREPGRWQVGVDSATVAGSIAVPRSRGIERPQIRADMERLFLSAGSFGGGFETLDPRELPGLSVHAEQFAFGTRELGEIDLEVRPDALGLRLVSFASRHGEMHIDASGSWLTGVNGARTRLAVNLSSTQVSSTLEKLGFDPVIEGELADVTASVEWPGPPSTNWMQDVDGDVAVRVETGSMLDIEPGAGRVVGLMSILALPRRLALDFRDVFNKGFVFDEITGDFLILDGDAYTDNLKLTGPAAEIGVAGRTGLADHDYEQQAVVTAEPGNMLPTVGGLIGGPGVGAALLIFTRIFKEPLKGIGRAVYCITGSWDEPEVERLTATELEQGRLCAALPPEGAAAAAGVEPVNP